MSENKSTDKDQKNGEQGVTRGLGTKEDAVQRRNDRKEIEKTGNKVTGTLDTEVQEDENLERATSTGAGEQIDTNTEEDQEEGSGAGRSGSKGREELRREDQPEEGRH